MAITGVRDADGVSGRRRGTSVPVGRDVAGDALDHVAFDQLLLSARRLAERVGREAIDLPQTRPCDVVQERDRVGGEDPSIRSRLRVSPGSGCRPGRP